ncbi:MAG: glycosyltransferase family 4 protein [Actinomycetota bacterium]
MKIAQIAPPWLPVPPRGYGGIEWVVSLLSDGLVERGHEVTLFAPGDSTTTATLESVFPVAPGPDAINSIWYDVVHAGFALRGADRFDVLHVHPWWSSLVAAVQTPVPVVHTLHTAFFDHVRRIYTQVYDLAWFVAISEAQLAQMPELRSAGVVYNGIDLDLYPLQREKEDFLLFLGRTAPEKGLARAILAARAAGYRLICAVKVSSETERREWEDNIEPLLGDDVEVLGEITHDEKVDLLRRARAVLFPIDWDEPFGLVMTEAMACGTPVIATRRGSVPEVIADGETGFIVEVEQFVEQTVDRLRRLDDIDPAACRSRVEDHFSRRAMLDGYERVYRQIVG